jgi:hypothetical protein
MSGKRTNLRLYLVVVIGIIIYGVLSQAAESKTEKKSGAKAEWRANMANLLGALTDLVPEMMTEDKDSDARFKEKSKQLVAAAAKIDLSKPHGAKAPDADPALKFLSKLFFQDMKRMGEVVDEGQISYAKSLARQSVSYCITCHTRNSAGSEFPLMKAFEGTLKNVSQVQRLSIYAATRQYDAAFNEAMGFFRDDQVHSGDQNRIATIGLMVAVRAKNSPERALLLAEQIQRSPVANDFLKTKAAQWVSDLRAWQKDFSKPLKSDDKLIEAARAMMKSESDVSGVKNLGSEVRHLRASTLMHSLLADYPNSKHTAEALFLIGNSYDVMGDLGYFSLGEVYFEACIDKSPHTDISRICFSRYKDSVVFGYSGSSGIHIPGAIQRHLNELETKARPIEKASNKQGTSND